MLKSVDRSDNNLNSVGIWGRQANLPTRCPCNSGCCIYSIIAKYILSYLINPVQFSSGQFDPRLLLFSTFEMK